MVGSAKGEHEREKVAALHEALADPVTKDEAFGIIRTLIDELRLIPKDGQLSSPPRARSGPTNLETVDDQPSCLVN
jgi:hypothetical protein